MTRYIDADKLKELLDEKYKEFTEKAKKDCPLQYQYMADGLDIAEQFVDSLQQEQPSLPDNLDEAAHNWAMKDSVVYISRKKSFKAGAEWMGWKIEGKKDNESESN